MEWEANKHHTPWAHTHTHTNMHVWGCKLCICNAVIIIKLTEKWELWSNVIWHVEVKQHNDFYVWMKVENSYHFPTWLLWCHVIVYLIYNDHYTLFLANFLSYVRFHLLKMQLLLYNNHTSSLSSLLMNGFAAASAAVVVVVVCYYLPMRDANKLEESSNTSSSFRPYRITNESELSFAKLL